MAQVNLSTKQKQTHIEKRLVVAKWEGRGSGMNGEFGVGRCKVFYVCMDGWMYFVFLGLYPWYMEFPRLGVKLEL